MRYADGIMCLSKSEADLQEMIKDLNRESVITVQGIHVAIVLTCTVTKLIFFPSVTNLKET